MTVAVPVSVVLLAVGPGNLNLLDVFRLLLPFFSSRLALNSRSIKTQPPVSANSYLFIVAATIHHAGVAKIVPIHMERV